MTDAFLFGMRTKSLEWMLLVEVSPELGICQLGAWLNSTNLLWAISKIKQPPSKLPSSLDSLLSQIAIECGPCVSWSNHAALRVIAAVALAFISRHWKHICLPSPTNYDSQLTVTTWEERPLWIMLPKRDWLKEGMPSLTMTVEPSFFYFFHLPLFCLPSFLPCSPLSQRGPRPKRKARPRPALRVASRGYHSGLHPSNWDARLTAGAKGNLFWCHRNNNHKLAALLLASHQHWLASCMHRSFESFLLL